MSHNNLPFWMATVTRDGETFEWGRFQQWNEVTAEKMVREIYPTATTVIITRWNEPLPKGQIELPLKHHPFQEYLGNFKRVRKALAKANNMLTSWKQIPLKLHLKKLYKIAKAGFIWTREDGKQIVCKNLRTLIARIKDYDGLNSKLIPLALRSVLRSAK